MLSLHRFGAVMQLANFQRRAFGLVELLVSIAIIGLLMGLALPAIQYSRESARRSHCKNNLKQIGLALHEFHDIKREFPAGFRRSSKSASDNKAWGWAVYLLPFMENAGLYDAVDPERNSLQLVLENPNHQIRFQSPVTGFICPSDQRNEVCHRFREFSGFAPAPWTGAGSWHTVPPPSRLSGISTSISNYVGSFGSFWRPASSFWTERELRGNGLLGYDKPASFADITDGTSYTFAAGERNWENYAAVWTGVDWWDQCHFTGGQMVVGTTYYRMNSTPQTYHLSCEAFGAAGFSSMHPHGSMFLMCDGSVHFFHEQTDFSSDPTNLGVYQRLGNMQDGQTIGNHEFYR